MRYVTDTVQTLSVNEGLRVIVLAAVLAWHAESGHAQQSQEVEAVQRPVIEEATGDESAGSVASDEIAEQEQTPADAAAGRVDDATTMTSEGGEGTSESTERPVESMTQDESSVTAEPASADDVDDLLQKAQAAFDVGDVISAMSFYRRAAELGDAEAQTRLGYLLDQAEQNQEAAEWLEKAAEQGHPEAAYYLAGMYVASTELTQDFHRAVELFESAAEQGHAASIRVLVSAYEKGGMKLIRSYDKAVAWLRAGVEAGDVWSIQRLARAYRNGDLGLRIDEEKADELESRVAQQRAQTD